LTAVIARALSSAICNTGSGQTIDITLNTLYALSTRKWPAGVLLHLGLCTRIFVTIDPPKICINGAHYTANSDPRVLAMPVIDNMMIEQPDWVRVTWKCFETRLEVGYLLSSLAHHIRSICRERPTSSWRRDRLISTLWTSWRRRAAAAVSSYVTHSCSWSERRFINTQWTPREARRGAARRAVVKRHDMTTIERVIQHNSRADLWPAVQTQTTNSIISSANIVCADVAFLWFRRRHTLTYLRSTTIKIDPPPNPKPLNRSTSKFS